ncbi:uncharacterized protein LOC143922387 [Arctopsyche grandis]|uniref:uncharacterized protein LOC143922348 n=1 Tax=Arctopsyche grandis TaxID=121162 RepID=UPI00406D7524
MAKGGFKRTNTPLCNGAKALQFESNLSKNHIFTYQSGDLPILTKMDPTFGAQQSKPLKALMYCGYCYSNGEANVIYNTHDLSSPTGKLTCPILRRYVCPICGATGDDAHSKILVNNDEITSKIRGFVDQRFL